MMRHRMAVVFTAAVLTGLGSTATVSAAPDHNDYLTPLSEDVPDIHQMVTDPDNGPIALGDSLLPEDMGDRPDIHQMVANTYEDAVDAPIPADLAGHVDDHDSSADH
jgi:hypothetical protein